MSRIDRSARYPEGFAHREARLEYLERVGKEVQESRAADGDDGEVEAMVRAEPRDHQAAEARIRRPAARPPS